MAKTPKIRLIKDKRREIAQEMERHRQALADLEKQASELEIAERVLISLGADDEVEGDIDGGIAILKNVPLAPIIRTKMKPENAPTIPQMILTALKDARAKGKRGLEPKEIAEFIAATWWPDVPQVAVGPIAWRMYKRHDLQKRESRYFLPRNDGDDDEKTS